MSGQGERIITVMNRQYRNDPATGLSWERKKQGDGTWSEWGQTEALPEEQGDPCYLYLITRNQAEGEPLHWSLFIAQENKPGTEYQVTGDATFMHYDHATTIDIMSSESFYTCYQLCEVDESDAACVKHYANTVPPPQAPDRAHVTKKCQGWVINVLRQLESQGIVSREKVDAMEARVQPV